MEGKRGTQRVSERKEWGREAQGTGSRHTGFSSCSTQAQQLPCPRLDVYSSSLRLKLVIHMALRHALLSAFLTSKERD